MRKSMTVILQRTAVVNDATMGVLYLKNEGATKSGKPVKNTELCYVLEDIPRIKKVWGKTRIPAGKYPIKFRKEGRFYNQYKIKFKKLFLKNKYKDINNERGMLHIVNIPNYKYVLIHIGNTHLDTAGCLLVGKVFDLTKKNPRLKDSTTAYVEVYNRLADILSKGIDLYIDIRNEKG